MEAAIAGYAKLVERMRQEGQEELAEVFDRLVTSHCRDSGPTYLSCARVHRGNGGPQHRFRRLYVI